MTGKDLARLRKAVGLSQTELAARAGVGRHAVSYWEAKPRVRLDAWAVRRMAEVLNLSGFASAYTRASWGVSHTAPVFPTLDWAALQRLAHLTPRPKRCGAKTCKGTPCQMKPEPGKRRCKLHGGKSTGPRTAEGIERIREAQRKRWEKWRAGKYRDD